MTDLFDFPKDDISAIIKWLERDGDINRVRMRKGASYRTFQHRAAAILRWYAKHGCTASVARESVSMVKGTAERLEVVKKRFRLLLLFTVLYVGSTGGFFVWLLT